MKSYNLYLATLITLLTSCVTQQASTIEGASYDERMDHTEHFVLPYGTVIIPGKWEKTHYNSVSWQQFFSNTDSIKIAIAFGAYDKYPFNTDGSKKIRIFEVVL